MTSGAIQYGVPASSFRNEEEDDDKLDSAIRLYYNVASLDVGKSVQGFLSSLSQCKAQRDHQGRNKR